LKKRKVLKLEKKYGVMYDKSGENDTREVRRSWRRDESGIERILI